MTKKQLGTPEGHVDRGSASQTLDLDVDAIKRWNEKKESTSSKRMQLIKKNIDKKNRRNTKWTKS